MHCFVNFKISYEVFSTSAIKAKKPEGLMFADGTIADSMMSVLINTSAPDFFIFEEAARKLNLWVEMRAKWLITMNSKEVPTYNMARDVEPHIRKYWSHETFEIIPLDNYNFVIGLGFLDRTNTLVVLFPDCICILDTCGQCVVMVNQDSGQDQKMLSAM